MDKKKEKENKTSYNPTKIESWILSLKVPYFVKFILVTLYLIIILPWELMKSIKSLIWRLFS